MIIQNLNINFQGIPKKTVLRVAPISKVLLPQDQRNPYGNSNYNGNRNGKGKEEPSKKSFQEILEEKMKSSEQEEEKGFSRRF